MQKAAWNGGPVGGGGGGAGEAGDHLPVPGGLVGVLEGEIEVEVGLRGGGVGGLRRVPALGERQEGEVPGEPDGEEVGGLGRRALVEFGLPELVAGEAGPAGQRHDEPREVAGEGCVREAEGGLGGGEERLGRRRELGEGGPRAGEARDFGGRVGFRLGLPRRVEGGAGGGGPEGLAFVEPLGGEGGDPVGHERGPLAAREVGERGERRERRGFGAGGALERGGRACPEGPRRRRLRRGRRR